MNKSCENCHYGKMEEIIEPCFKFNENGGCFNDKSHPDWTPMTNGDHVRQMTDSDLEELWSVIEFDEKYQPECSKTGKGCRYVNFDCEACPATFRNWLEATTEVMP